jgi:hypothetical protein
VQVEVDNPDGTVASTFTGDVTLSPGPSYDGGTGSLSGMLTVAVVKGVASFDNLSVTAPGGYQLRASTSDGSNSLSGPFHIGYILAFTHGPTDSGPDETIKPPVQVQVENPDGTPAGIFPDNVTISLGTVSGTGVLSGGQPETVDQNGVASFPNLSVSANGEYTLNASMSDGSHGQSNRFHVEYVLNFAHQPTNALANQTIAPAVQVEVDNPDGTVASAFTGDVTLSLSPSYAGLMGTLSGKATEPVVKGVATFPDLSVDQNGQYLMTATAPGANTANSSVFHIGNLLAFTQEPTVVGWGTAFQVQVQLQAPDGQAIIGYNGDISINLISGKNVTGPTVSLTSTATAVNGLATFPGLSLKQFGDGYTFTAATLGTTPDTGTSDPFNVSYTPAQIRTGYGINDLSLDGTGQTIAVVAFLDNPNIFKDLDAFDRQFGVTASGPSLFSQYGPASSFLSVVNQNGQPGPLPMPDPTPALDHDAEEEALDVEWAHAIAPGARIVLLEASPGPGLFDTAPNTAANLPGVSVVSTSFGGGADPTESPGLDKVFNHPGVVFLRDTGDFGAPGNDISPNEIGVGGTSLTINPDGTYLNEVGWNGSGGGISPLRLEPLYQQGTQNTGTRATPDVAFLADPNTGVAIADSFDNHGANSFERIGGTSLATPCWAALFALVNQGRAADGGKTYNQTSPTEALDALYNLPGADFHDITSGSNRNLGVGFDAGPGYDEVTGRGTPIANFLIPDLIKFGLPTVAQDPAGQTVVPGQTATFTAAVNGITAARVQWQVSTDGGQTWSPIPGATSTTYGFTAALSQDGNEFRAVFTNSDGTVATSAAKLTILVVTLGAGAPAGANLATLSFQPVATPPPAGLTPVFDTGALDFTVSGLSPGGIARVVIQLPAGTLQPTTSYAYYKETAGVWSPFNYDAQTNTGAQIDTANNQVVLTVVDGGRGDEDGLANGSVLDPGALFITPVQATIVNAPTASTVGTAIALTSVVADGGDPNGPFTYSWSVTKSHGGAPPAFFQGGSSASFTFTPDADGTYVVTLTATDQNGAASNLASRTIVVTSAPPTPLSGDVTGLVSAMLGPLTPVKNRHGKKAKGRFSQTVTIFNNTDSPIAGPLALVLSGLPRKKKGHKFVSAVAVRNQAGISASHAAGSPFVTDRAGAAALQPSTGAVFEIEFQTSGSGRIPFNPIVVGGVIP